MNTKDNIIFDEHAEMTQEQWGYAATLNTGKLQMTNECACRYPDEQCAWCERKDRHANKLETRAFEIRDLLLKRGYTRYYAGLVGERFARVEFLKSVVWS